VLPTGEINDDVDVDYRPCKSIVVFTEKKPDEKKAGRTSNGSCKTPAQRDGEHIFTCCTSSELDSNASRLELMPDSSVGVSLQ